MADQLIRELNDASLDQLRAAERAVLILTKSSCGSCHHYQLEIKQRLQAGDLNGVLVAKIVLDRPGSVRFKQENSWIRDLPYLPYTIVYREGHPVDQFAASRAGYLLERLRQAMPESAPH